ncbi:MAG: tRNA uridine-5-carboxymethylaminomethyl(34) synthesis GTPase MnmE [bacterium]|nr:tRNA uridine-5-carboxymethylaminomethyl(34) synthesis GTPase MnmE [bacterium]
MEEIDTIAAIITAPGKSAVSVIRLSGADAFSITERIGAGKDLEHHRIYVRTLSYDGKELDKAIISAFKSPNSYTGEDVVEISVHGGRISAERILKRLIDLGCRPAERGEFTKRAFINGKMTLMEAESVLTKVNAMSEETFDFASKDAIEKFERSIERLREKLLSLKAYVQSSIDFPEDVEFSFSKTKNMLSQVKEISQGILEKSKRGLFGENYPLMVIAGKTNTGKSTLFNSLLESDRAIVSHEEGTTRDIISEWAMIEGRYVKIMDTAGLREAQSDAESQGIRMVQERISKADLVLYLYDLSKEVSDEELSAAKSLCRKVILCGSKSDIKSKETKDLEISALTGEGMKDLKKRIAEELSLSERSEISVNERQMNLIERINERMDGILKIGKTIQPEILDEKINVMMDEIKELTGETSSEDVLESIFKNFCIGK